MNGKLVVCQVEAQAIMLLALEMWEACFLSIFARMLEFGLRPFLFHAPIIGKGLLQIGKGLFRSAFRNLIDPGELFTLDLIVFSLEVVDLDPFPFCPCRFPASHSAPFAKRDFLLRGRIEANHMRSLHVLALPNISQVEQLYHECTIVSISNITCGEGVGWAS